MTTMSSMDLLFLSRVYLLDGHYICHCGDERTAETGHRCRLIPENVPNKLKSKEMQGLRTLHQFVLAVIRTVS